MKYRLFKKNYSFKKCQTENHKQKFATYSADSRLIWKVAAPCGPFRRLTCALRPFSTFYMDPAALSVRISTSVCVSVSKSPKKAVECNYEEYQKS